MKKGSSIRKCTACGKHLFWVVPTGNIPFGLFREVTHKEICQWRGYKSKYYCLDCYEIVNKENK